MEGERLRALLDAPLKEERKADEELRERSTRMA